jgi:L-rhamnose mutarotase
MRFTDEKRIVKEKKNRYNLNIRRVTRDKNEMFKEGFTMIKGFKMKLYEGQEAEYEKRHNQLWPEMKDMIHEYGGKNYTIFLDKETLTLFGYIEIEDEERWAKGADTAINRKWWDFMADIMETNPDNSPVSIDLKEVFHLD